jgi:hypothetical protein
MDHDGNLRVYSFNEKMKTWEVTWQVSLQPCEVHGLSLHGKEKSAAADFGKRRRF